MALATPDWRLRRTIIFKVMMTDFSKEDFSWYAKEIKSMIMEGHQYIPVIMRETDYMRYKKEEKLDLYFPVLCSYIRACLPKKSQTITSEALDLLWYLYKDSSPVWMAEFFLDILQEEMMPKIRVKILDYM